APGVDRASIHAQTGEAATSHTGSDPLAVCRCSRVGLKRRSTGSSLPGLTRQSINLRQDSFARTMDARVKPAHDPLRSMVARFAFARQPLIEPAHVDHHALVSATADLLVLVARLDIEFDTAAIDPRDFRFRGDVVSHGSCRHMADVDGGADRALARLQK